MSTIRSERDAQPPQAHVGAYRLLTRIGEGGMGVVHLAQGPTGERVALKVLRPHVIGDDEARERLSREVASLRRVRSPRVAEIVDADPWGATPYVVTRYVPGLSLHEHARQNGPLVADDLRHFAAGLAEAVLAVHAAGVLHRDIKPSNVLLEGRSPVLIDFGLARLAEDPRMTVTGWLLGTPGYLAPEILYGDDATTASDVHSWAATVVFAATGRPPFGRGPAMAIMDRVRRGEHDLTGVPPDLRRTLLAALAPDPLDRPTLAALLSGLRPQPGPHQPGPHRDDATTVPLALVASGDDDDATDVLERPRSTAPTRIDPAWSVGRPLAQRREAEPARGPGTETAWRPPPDGLARVQRGALLAGLFAALAVGVASAPYVAVALVAVATLLVRTWSWTGQARRERMARRGRPRWYDTPLTTVTAPWYLLVATGGTLVLLTWAVFVAVVAGFGSFVLRLPVEIGLLLMGAALSFSLWWGPGSRRVRGPVRTAVLAATRRTWVGWAAVTAVGLALAGVLLVLAEGGTVWDPQPGAPWRDGTLLGDLLRFF